MNAIHWNTKAIKQLRKLERSHQRMIVETVDDLHAMPACASVIALVNHACGYRLRIGRYRVLFDWDRGVRIVEIQQVRKRDEGTY